jgi:hypothetical protein
MFLLFVLLVCAVTASLPQILKRFTKLKNTSSFLPPLAAFLFFIAFFIPDIHISKETSTFQQHFVGGGLYGACLYFYLKQVMSWKFSWLVDLLLLYAFTSSIGVANEILEFTLDKLNITQIHTGDTDWDLLANTLGAFTGFILLKLWFNKVRGRK